MQRDSKLFEKAEESGRSKAIRALCSIPSIFEDGFEDYKIVSTEGTCNWDFELRDKLNNALLGIVEAKDRRFSTKSPLISGQGAQLEEYKYNVLRSKAEKHGIPAFYLSTFADGKYCIWDVCTAKVTEDDRKCNKRTVMSRTDKVLKHCYYFTLDQCKFMGDI